MRIITAISAVLMFVLFGCSSSNNSMMAPVPDGDAVLETVFNPEQVADFQPNELGWQQAYSGEFIPDGSGGFELVDNRDAMFNFNATNFILSAGAFHYQIVSITGNRLELNLTINNPTSLIVYDLRMIFNNIGSSVVENPDSYTTLFSPAKSPYFGFAQSDPDRMFPVGPDGSDTRHIFLQYNGGAVGFTIAVSTPKNCEEPFEISNMALIGDINQNDGGWATLYCTVKDHQWDIQYVAADLTLFTGRQEFMIVNPTDPNRFELFFSNDLLAPGGTYPLWVAAKSTGSPLLCYNMLEIFVSGGPEPPVVTITTPWEDPFTTPSRFTEIAGYITNFDGTEAIMEVNGDQQTIAVVDGNFSETAIFSAYENLVKIIATGPGGVGTDTVTVFSTAASSDLWIRLTWDTDDNDVDLYVTEPAGFTCWYMDKISPDTLAEIDVDETSGYGPEHYYLSVQQGHILIPGTYEVDVHYYSGDVTCTATILVYKGSDYYGEYSHVMTYADSAEKGPENRRQGLDSWWDNVVDIQMP
jgi:hypothetical protein